MKLKTSLLLTGFVLLLSAPLLWGRLDPDYSLGTVALGLDLARGLEFFRNLLPAVALGLLFAGALRFRHRLPRLPRPARLEQLKERPWAIPALIALLWLPGLFLGSKGLSQATFAAQYVLLAVGLNITVGMAGILVLGYSAYFAIGAYAFAVLQQWIWLPWWLALPVGFAASALVGWLVALPSLRLRGDYLAIVTLGFAEALREILRNGGAITGGDKGIVIAVSHRINGLLGLTSQQVAWMAAAAVAVLGVAAIDRIYHSRLGRAWVAIREDEVAAGAMGIPTVRMKILAFSLSAGFAGLSGVLYAGFTVFVDPSACTFEESVLVLAMVILGGLGSIPGSIVGAILLFLIPTWLRDWFPQMQDYRLLIFGMILVAVMLTRPQGLLGSNRHKAELEGAPE